MTKRTIRAQPWKSSYTDETAQKFYDLRAQGKSLVQAAKALGTTRKTLDEWAHDPNKPEFQEAYKAAHEASQAYREDLLETFLTGSEKITGAQKDLLVFYLRTQFKEDWAEKKESTININDQTQKLTDTELDEKLKTFLNKALGIKPTLKVVGEDGSQES